MKSGGNKLPNISPTTLHVNGCELGPVCVGVVAWPCRIEDTKVFIWAKWVLEEFEDGHVLVGRGAVMHININNNNEQVSLSLIRSHVLTFHDSHFFVQKCPLR
jgi:hypothetical protein